MADEQSLEALQVGLRDDLPMLNSMLKEFKDRAAPLPHDWEIQDDLKSLSYYVGLTGQAISEALAHPVKRNDAPLLALLKREVLCLAETLCYSELSLAIKTKDKAILIDPVVRGAWDGSDLLPVKGKLRERITVLIKSLGRVRTHIIQLRDPVNYPWKESRTAQEITALAKAAERIEEELAGLLSTQSATVAYSRYLRFETLLESYEYFEADVLGNGHARWKSSIAIHKPG